MSLELSDDIVLPSAAQYTTIAFHGRAQLKVYTAPPFETFLLSPSAKRIYAIEMRYEMVRAVPEE